MEDSLKKKRTFEREYLDKAYALLQKDISFNPKIRKFKRKLHFFVQLELLLSAGVDIKSALELIQKNTKEAEYADTIRKLLNAILGGASLSEAVKKLPLFSSYDYHSLRIGEETGRIVHVFAALATYYSNLIQQRRAIINALSYPFIVLITAFGAILFLMKFVVPMFKDIFKRFKGELPKITQVVMGVSDWVSENLLLLIVLTVALIFLMRSVFKMQWFKQYLSYLFKIPYFGSLYHKTTLLQYCEAMVLFLEAKVPLDKAIEMTAEMTSFYPLEIQLKSARNELMNGSSFAQTLQNQPFFDTGFVAMIEAGERVNKLDLIFNKLVLQLKNDVESLSQNIKTAVEPVILIVLATLIAIILIAIYLPLLSLNSIIG